MKVYERITVGWNEETEYYDKVICEDSFDYYGALDLAMPDPTAQMSITVGSLDYETVPTPVTNEYEWPTQYVDESSPGGFNRLLFSGIMETPSEPTCQGVQIGNQCWMSENLTVTHYRNGEPIHPDGLDEPAADDVWISTTEGAYGEHPDVDLNIQGRLYNWHAVNDPRGICPGGWSVPTDGEIKQLEMYLGMSQEEADDGGWRGTNEGSKLAGRADLWVDGILENNPEFGTSGFDFLPGGYRNSGNGQYNPGPGTGGLLWSSTEGSNEFNAWNRKLGWNNSEIRRDSNSARNNGMSVRCIASVTCQGVQIGNQCWTAENLKVTHYNNGEPIHPNGLDEPASDDVWSEPNTEGAYGEFPDHDVNVYGRLYNWYAVNDPRGICPEGFHVPSHEEWAILARYVCEEAGHVPPVDCNIEFPTDETGYSEYHGSDEGSRLAGNGDLWYGPDSHPDSPDGALEGPSFGDSGLNLIPGACRGYSIGGYGGQSCPINQRGMFWSSSEYSGDVQHITAWSRALWWNNAAFYRAYTHKGFGMSVRCVTNINPILPSIPGEYWACDHLRLYNADGWSDPLSESCTEDMTSFYIPPGEFSTSVYASCDPVHSDGESVDVRMHGIYPDYPDDISDYWAWCSDNIHIGQLQYGYTGTCQQACGHFGYSCEYRVNAAGGGDPPWCEPPDTYQTGECSDIFGTSWSSRCKCGGSLDSSDFDWLYTTGDEACASLNTPNPEEIPTLQGIHTANQYCREVLDESSFPDLAQSEAIAYSDGYCTPESMTYFGPEFCAMFGGFWTHGDYVIDIPEDLTYNSYQYTFYEGGNSNLYIQHFPSFSDGQYDQVNGLCLRHFSLLVSQTSYLAENVFAPLLEYPSFRYVTTKTASDGLMGFYSGTTPGSEEPPGVVQIGDQCWMDKNLDVTEYNNGDPILTGYSGSEWGAIGSEGTPAYAIYDDDPANSVIYGNLYNGYVVEDPRGICPEGFHVPSEEEWVILEDYISSDSGGQYSGYEGVALKDEGYLYGDGYWSYSGDPSEEGLDVYGWTGLPAGERSVSWGAYNYGPGWGTQAHFWSSTEQGAATWEMFLSYTTTTMHYGWSSKGNGYSVRCIFDFSACPQVSTLQTVTPGLGYTVAMEVPFEECGVISGDESFVLYEGELLDLSSGVDLLHEGSSTTNVYKQCDNVESITQWEDQGLFNEGQPYENIVKMERIPKTALVYEPCHGCGDAEYRYICGKGAPGSNINFSEYVLAEHPEWDIIGPCGDEFLQSYTFDVRSMWPLDFENEIYIHEWPLMDGYLLLSGEHDPWWATGGVNTFPISPGGIHTAFQYCKENHGDNYIAVIHLTNVDEYPLTSALSHVRFYDSPEEFQSGWHGEQYDLTYFRYWSYDPENNVIGWQETGINLHTPYFWRQITCAPYGLPLKTNADGFGGELDTLVNRTYAITVDEDTFGFDWNMCPQNIQPAYLNPTEWLTGNLYEGDIYIWKSLTCSSTEDQPDYEPITIELDNTSYSNPGSVGIATSHWEFGDGNDYTCDGVCSPPLDESGGVYEYAVGFWGQTTVCLIVTDLNGDVNSVCRVIGLDNPYINDPPVTRLEVS